MKPLAELTARRCAVALAWALALILACPAGAAPILQAPFRSLTPLGPGTGTVALVELNGDGALDLAVGSRATHLIAILLNAGDGELQPPTPLASIDNVATIVASDLNADGHSDLVVGHLHGSAVSVFLGRGDGGFEVRRDYSTGRESHSIAIGDLNRDGQLDLLVANSEPFFGRSVSVLLGNGDGRFRPQVDTAMDGVSPSTIAIADFNEDGLPDLVAGYEGGATFVYVMLGLGDGRFGQMEGQSSGYNPVTVDAGDVDEDGHQDFIVGGTWSNDVSFHYGLGNGQFAARSSIPIPGAAFVRLADVDRDGHLDVVTPAAVMLGHGDRTFDAPVAFLSDRSPASVAVGDLDGDGHMDLVTASPYPGTVSVIRATGAGAFQGPVPTATARNPYRLAAGDVNHDGRIDIAVACYNDRTVSVLLGSGDGTFPSRHDITGDFAPAAVELVDLDRDGSLDLVTANFGVVSTMRGSGTGAFGPRSDVAVGPGAQSLATGDFNEDGWPDVVTPNFGTHENERPYGFLPDSTVSILFGAGDGTLTNRIDFVAGLAPRDVQVGDVNHDGNDDVVVAITGASSVSVLIGNGDGTFLPPQEFSAGGRAVSLVLGDFNSDGALDVAAGGVSGYSSAIGLLIGNGDGTLRPAIVFPDMGMLNWLGAGDWNDDGSLDLATTTESSNTVHLLLNRGDGTFAPSDGYGTGVGPVDGLATDLNGDGRIDIVTADFYGGTISTLLAIPVDSPTAVLVTLGTTETRPGRVRIIWFTSRPLGTIVTAERRSALEEWRTIGKASEDGVRLILEDDSVMPGVRYAYRLRGPDGHLLTPEAWVDVPAGWSLALSGLSPGPSRGSPSVVLDLETSEPARLVAYDALGRRVLERTVGPLDPGPHRIEVTEANAWKSGMYFAQLVQGGRSARAKWCLLR